jgi:polysaccharide export outer membrane protein
MEPQVNTDKHRKDTYKIWTFTNSPSIAKWKNTKVGLTLGILILCLMLPLTLSAQKKEVHLSTVEVQDMREKAIVSLGSDGRLAPKAFQLKDPPRLRLYLPGAILSWEEKEVSYKAGLIKRIEAEQYSEKPLIVKVDIYLAYPTSYTMEANERLLTLKLDKEKIFTPKEQAKEAKRYYKEGKHHYKREEFEEAILNFEKALDFDPKLSRAENYIQKAKKGVLEGEKLERERLENLKAREIERVSKREEETKSQTIKKHYTLGRAFYQEGKLQKAISQFDRVLALDAKHKGALRHKKKAEEELKEVIAEKKEKERKNRIVRYYEEGKTYYKKGEFPPALTSFEKVLKLDPENKKALKYREKCKVILAREAEEKKLIEARLQEREEAYLDKTREELEKEGEIEELKATRKGPAPVSSPEVILTRRKELLPRRETSEIEEAKIARKVEEVVGLEVEEIEVRELPRETQVIIIPTGRVVYSSFELKDPPRLVIDIPDAILKWEKKEMKVEKGAIEKIRCGQFQEEPPISRVVIDFKEPGVEYRVGKRDNRILVSIAKPPAEREEVKERREEEVILPTEPKKAEKYTIGIGDLLDISVWVYDELAKEVTVRSDGRISFPLVGDIKASGLTPEQLDKEITRGLTLYVKEPQVTVIVKEVAAVRPEVVKKNKVFILGQVKSPGIYRFSEKVSFTEAITLAGGVTEEASFEKVTVTTKKGKVIPINLNRLLIQGDKSEDITLQDGDTIYIAEARKVLILGEVKSPGAYNLPEKKIGVLGGVVGLAGSYTEDAVLKSVALLRGGRRNPQMILVDMNRIIKKAELQRDVILEPGDIIYVPRRTIASINYVIRQIMPSLRAAEWAEEWKRWPRD